jgi:hypothetical protein
VGESRIRGGFAAALAGGLVVTGALVGSPAQAAKQIGATPVTAAPAAVAAPAAAPVSAPDEASAMALAAKFRSPVEVLDAVRIVVHAEDRDNFNPDAKDITTNIEDAENGRFAELGWAKAFNSSGSLVREVSWTVGPTAKTAPEPAKPQR